MNDLERFSDSEPEELEHELIKDSVLEIANADFRQTEDFDDFTPGKLRANIAQDFGEKYQGKPVKRKSFVKKVGIQEESDAGSELSVEDLEEDGREASEVEDEGEDDEVGSGSEEGSEGEEEEEDGSEVLSESEIEDDEEAESGNTGYNLQSEEGIDIYSARSTDINKDIKRGQALKNQLSIYEDFLKCRIKLQKGLSSANRLYQKDDFKKFKDSLSPDGLSALSSACESVKTLMGNLLELQVEMLKASTDYCQFRSKQGGSKKRDDESITSEDSGNEKLDADEPPPKKSKTNKSSDILQEIMDEYRPYRNDVIQKWNDKTRLASGKINSSGASMSTLKQIEQIMCDKNRLIRRTQLKRSEYDVLRMAADKEPKASEEEVPKQMEGKEVQEMEYDPEVYDDDDFYHKLLREFIERKSSDLSTSANLGKQWTELQKLRSKIKRKIDVRASKGRKLRYTVHSKLIGFMAPVPYCTWTETAENELYRSLFGKSVTKKSL